MTLNLRALGLSLLAVLAMSAMTASAATADKPAKLTAEAGTVMVDWMQTDPWFFERVGHPLTCKTVSLSGEGSNGVTTLSNTTSTFGQCESPFHKKPATVSMNECTFTFHLTAEPGHDWTAIMDIGCPEKKEISITIYSDAQHTVPICIYHIPPQTGKTQVDLTNEPAGSEVNGVKTPKDFIIADFFVQGIKSQKTGGFLSCGPNDDGNALLAGSAELIGTNSEKKQTGITVSTYP